MVELAGGDQRFRDDRGGADPRVTAALAAYASGTGTEHAALTALAAARLLVPVVAVRTDEPDPRGGEKGSEMAMPVIVGADGRRAVPAFTCGDSLHLWRPAARPVPVPAQGVWQSAVAESCAVIVDIAGPVPLAVEGARLAALAEGKPAPRLHEDPDVWQAVVAATSAVAPGVRVRFGSPQPGTDLALELAQAADGRTALGDDVASLVADAVLARLSSRVHGGIAVTVLPFTEHRPG